MMHRDIKPANVFFREDGTAVLGDLGLVGEETASTISRTGQALGTPRYMPPEVLQGLRWTPQGDLFAAGITLWEFAVGVHPNTFFDQSITMFLQADLRLPSLIEAGAYRNPALQVLLDSLLEVQDKDRPPSAEMALSLLGEEHENVAGDAAALANYRPITRELQNNLDDPDAETQIGPAGSRGKTVRPSQSRAPLSPPPLERTQRPPHIRTTSQVPILHMAGSQEPSSPASGALLGRAGLGTLLGGGLLVAAIAVGGVVTRSRTTTLPRDAGTSKTTLREFPPDFHLSHPRRSYPEPEEVLLTWDTPVKAFVVGSASTGGTILEFPRGPSHRPAEIRFPAPEPGSPYQKLYFTLEDREGGQIHFRFPPEEALPCLTDAARAFLEASAQGASEKERKRLWAPLRTPHVEGVFLDLDPELHAELDQASADL
jgi:serine/threonine protein kinase